MRPLARHHRKLGVLALLLVVASGLVASACGTPAGLKHQTRILGRRVTVTVTQAGGAKLVVRKDIPLEPGETALEALRQVADVRLAPGGVVAQVNGKGGGALGPLGPEQAGWFYRVDGAEADIDPAKFRLQPGDSLWWDLRRYDIYPQIPIAVGEWPEPLVSGYRGHDRPLDIVYGDGFEKQAQAVASQVFQKENPKVYPLVDSGRFGRGDGGDSSGGDTTDSGGGILGHGDPSGHVAVQKGSNTIVIARWEDAQLDPYVADIGLDPRGYGLTTWIEGNDIRHQGPDDEFSRVVDQGRGVVWASTIDGQPDSEIVWMVTGTTDQGVRAALHALLGTGLQYYLSGAVDIDAKVLP